MRLLWLSLILPGVQKPKLNPEDMGRRGAVLVEGASHVEQLNIYSSLNHRSGSRVTSKFLHNFDSNWKEWEWGNSCFDNTLSLTNHPARGYAHGFYVVVCDIDMLQTVALCMALIVYARFTLKALIALCTA